MIKVVNIDTMDGVKDLVFEATRNTETGRFRSSYLYRGMPDEDFHLITSLQRNCGSQADILEGRLLESFAKYAIIDDPTVADSIWRTMIIGQHHGLPTRLLDWTYSVLVAMHFAHTEWAYGDFEKHNCAIWQIDVKDLNNNLPDRYGEALKEKRTEIFTADRLAELAPTIQQYDKEMAGKAMLMLEPPSIDQRIVQQYSFFSVVPKGIVNMDEYLDKYTQNTTKYVIDKSLRWDIRELLDQMNINERMIYPGLDGITKWLARHYFVRE